MSFLLDIAKDLIDDASYELRRGGRHIVRDAGSVVAAGLAGAAMMKGLSNNQPNPSPTAYPQGYPQGYPPQNMPPGVPPQPAPAVGPSTPAAPTFSFYANIEGTKHGPYNEIQFKRLVDNDLADANTMVWKEGMTEWQPAGQVKMMEHIFSKNPSTQQSQSEQPAQQPAPAMPQMPQQKAYYVNLNNQMVGPFTAQQLQQFAQAGEFTQQMYVWCEGMPEWLTAGRVEELAPLFGPAMPQMPKV